MATLAVGGAGSPRTPQMRTRSGADVVEADRVEAGDDVGVGVRGRLDLVQQLGRDGVDGDPAAGAGCLVMTHEPSSVDLGDREPERLGEAVAELLEEGEVAARRLGAALDDVAGGDGAGEAVPVGRRPAPPPRRRADDDGGVGDPRADDDVGALGAAPGRCPSRRGRRWR